jgi:hypothetical protein
MLICEGKNGNTYNKGKWRLIASKLMKESEKHIPDDHSHFGFFDSIILWRA